MSDSAPRTTAFVNAVEPGRPEPLPVRPEGAQRLRFKAGSGLWQLSAVLDGSRYDWESMYEDLFLYGNRGQRTGPWDFKLGPAHPLVPAYRFSLDGRPVGLWFFERPAVRDIGRVFRGRAAFALDVAGEHEICLEPFRPAAVRWVSALLERDPEDALEPVPEDLRPAPGNVPAARWTDPGFWEEQRRRLATTHRAWAGPLGAALDRICRGGCGDARDVRLASVLDIPLLAAAAGLDGRDGALDLALRSLDEAVARPHWGNPNPDGYSHDGDMGAALTMRALGWALHMLGGRLGPERRERLLAKLALQGNRFLDLALLNRDYWGGSLLQDHGWRSLWSFGTAALHLYGVIPDAERWLQYVMPRLRRSLAAMPSDGVTPPSSHCSPWLHLFDPAQYRDALAALGGPDIYAEAPFEPVAGYLSLTSPVRDAVRQDPAAVADRLIGPSVFLARMAADRSDARAARLLAEMLERTDWGAVEGVLDSVDPVDGAARQRIAHGLLWGFLAYEPGATASPAEAPVPRLVHFPDSAEVFYDEPESGCRLRLRCGPPNGYRAYRNTRCCNDRLGGAPVAGHFEVSVAGVPLLAGPVHGYRLRTFLGNVLLIDGRGQRDDVGYPMSIPSWRDHGAEIAAVRRDKASGTGMVRLDLEPAYPEDLGVLLYERDLLFPGGRRLVVRDRVVLAEPRMLSWLFHARDDIGLAPEEGLRFRAGTGPSLSIEPGPADVRLSASVGGTDVVYSYTPLKPVFVHIRYDTAAPLPAATVDFNVVW